MAQIEIPDDVSETLTKLALESDTSPEAILIDLIIKLDTGRHSSWYPAERTFIRHKCDCENCFELRPRPSSVRD